jgi:hypothetical protein
MIAQSSRCLHRSLGCGFWLEGPPGGARHPYPMAPGMRFWKWRITAASDLGVEIAN